MPRNMMICSECNGHILHWRFADVWYCELCETYLSEKNIRQTLYTEAEMQKAVEELKLKVFALLNGLEVENIPKFMTEADVGDYGKFGLLMTQRIKQKVEDEREALINMLTEYKEDAIGNVGLISPAAYWKGMSRSYQNSIDTIRARSKP